MEERKVTVDGTAINYVRVGTGEYPVLLLPGAVGSIWTEFKPQVEGLDRRKFTIIAWDPPGYGKSRLPDRNFSNDFFERDAVLRDFLYTLIVRGNKDALICPEHAIYVKEHIPGAKLKMYEKERHDLYFHYPDVSNELATQFLTE